jgi:poly(hydroxyalkanoate) depolymerase family esterase
MNETLKDLMRDATRLTRSGKLTEATALLQRLLGGKAPVEAAPSGDGPVADVLDGCVFEIEVPRITSSESEIAPVAPLAGQPAPRAATSRGEFLSGVHSHASLTRQYKLYVPPAARETRPLPLVVMLHGCTQNPDDFAVGTGMNERALQQGFFVLYPAQAQEANPSRCWNWFKHNHQQRGRGEPALIASLTQTIMKTHRIDPDRVYIAGLSAGGAMAAIMGAAYPDLYAAVGVHSGLAPGAAANMSEALNAMNGGMSGKMPLGTGPVVARASSGEKVQPLGVPTIVFHGDQDKTVNPANGDHVIEARLASNASHSAATRLEQGSSAKGRRFTTKVYRDGSDHVLGEHWLVHGAGHAWFGGHPAGSYTDALGPDATGEMLRFFLEHPKR